MREDGVARDRRVRHTAREGKSRAGRSQRLEAEMLQVARAADVPWVGNDEASRGVELAKRSAFFGDGGHDDGLAGASGMVNPIVSGVRRCRMARLPRLCQPKERGARAGIAREEGLPWRRLPIKPLAVANSCSFSPGARCSPPAGSKRLPAKGRCRGPSCRTR